MNNITNNIYWPDFIFPPINLWSLPPAAWFYLTNDEKIEKFLTVRDEYST